ncbi:MAG: exopolyphosphatase [Bacteroidetes bacterium]|nr:exopolyphosphatase [Bacteroidota bacterium]
MIKAVIDLGTNTFHLLIADVSGGFISPILKEQIAVKLGEGGIHQNQIGPEAFERGQIALEKFRHLLNQHQIESVQVVATSAIRGASNGHHFIEEAKRRSQFSIQCISGLEEAMLIARGVLHELPDLEHPFLIMDIGGGSVEFILCQDNEVIHKESIDIGAARLLAMFNPADPIDPMEVHRITSFLQEKLSGLIHRCHHHHVQSLIGSAGSFESILDLIEDQLSLTNDRLSEHCYQIKPEHFQRIHRLLLSSTLEERKGMAGMADFRVEMMVLASILIHVVLEMGRFDSLYCSLNSLKEGLILGEEYL